MFNFVPKSSLDGPWKRDGPHSGANFRLWRKPEIQTGPLPGGGTNANQNGSRRRRSAMARALARLYAILRDASAGKCHRRHLATVVAPEPAIPCRFAEQDGRLLGFSHSPPHEGAFVKAPYAIWRIVRRPRRVRSCRLWRMASAARRRRDLANRAV